MSTPNGPEHQVDAAEQRASIERRREALRRIGRTGAAVGAASPLAALATSGGRPWVKHKTGGNKVHASVSGANSVVLSAQPAKQQYGNPCDYYRDVTKLPSSCKVNWSTAKKFKDCLPTAGRTCSNGKQTGQSGCLFDKTITELCRDYPSKPETVWITAYCNASLLNSECKFPYNTADVSRFWSHDDSVMRSSAFTFFQSYMMNGPTFG